MGGKTAKTREKHNNATPKKATKPKSVTDEQLAEAINATGGNYASVCAWLAKQYKIHIDRTTVCHRISESDQLQETLSAAKEKKLDVVEGLLDRLLKKGDKAAIFFYLKTQGKKRGWSERREITGEDGASLTPPNITVVFDD